jgi:hypothetical protein
VVKSEFAPASLLERGDLIDYDGGWRRGNDGPGVVGERHQKPLTVRGNVVGRVVQRIGLADRE